MPIPTKGLLDPEPKPKPEEPQTDTVALAIEQFAAREAEAAENMKQAQAELARRQQRAEQDTQEARSFEDKYLEQVVTAKFPEIKTREELMQRIREMRDANKPYEPPPPPPPTGAMLAQIEKEMEDGRKALEQYNIKHKLHAEERAAALKEDADRQGHSTPVVHPNHGQDVQAPAIGATLGKVRNK